jgi:hypothetical protein
LLVATGVRVTLVAEGVMITERRYAALLLTSLSDPSAELAGWLEAPSGPPPIGLALMASMLQQAAVRLTDLDGNCGDGAP